MSRAVVLLSGGLDSTTTLAMALADGHEVLALSVRYGQRHALELECAVRVAARYGVRHVVSDVDLRSVGGSALTTGLELANGRALDEMATSIPASYVPARNTVMLSLALAWAEVTQSSAIYLGVNALDYSGYPDCRPEFLEAYERMANLATKRAVEGEPVRIVAPLVRLTKAEIIRAGIALSVDYSLTSTCYDPTPEGACGQCDACLLRLKGFQEVGVTDPVPYRSAP